MRLVAVAPDDTVGHLFTSDLEVPDGDVFIHAGDLCRGGGLDELREAAAWIASLPHPHKIIIAGNHDWSFVREPAAARALFRGAHYLEDAELVIDGVRFYGSPWQPEFGGWAFNLPRGEALAAVWRNIPTSIDVLITHGPPAGIGDRSAFHEHTGCAELRRRVADVVPRRAPTVIDIDARSLTPLVVPPHGRRDDDEETW